MQLQKYFFQDLDREPFEVRSRWRTLIACGGNYPISNRLPRELKLTNRTKFAERLPVVDKRSSPLGK